MEISLYAVSVIDAEVDRQVHFGPFPSQAKAGAWLKSLPASGYYGGYIISIWDPAEAHRE